MLRYVPLLNQLVTRAECRILDLPKELLLMIFERLSLLSQACFALTCKRLLSEFGEVLESSAFDFPHPTISNDGVQYFDPRWRTRFGLLLRLEGGRWLGGRWWKYCGQCLKLHPRHELIPDYESCFPPEQSRCRLPGIVTLCHCVHLNAREKIQLIEELETGKLKNPTHYHKCSFDDAAGMLPVEISIDISLSEMGELEVHTRYDIQHGVNHDLEPRQIYLCPHVYFFEGHRLAPGRYYCKHCQTTREVSCGNGQSSLQVMRNLGGKRYPAHRTWDNQCDRRYDWIHL